MHLVIYGSEGSGKGTQARLLSQKLGIPIYTSGDLVRAEAAKEKGALGDVCRQALSGGTYVTDAHMFLLWGNKLKSEEAQKGFILDGFPRTVHQAEFLLQKGKEAGYEIDKVIYLKLTDEEAVKRLVKRDRKLYEGSTISHDSPERVQARLSQFRKEEEKIVTFFRKKNMVLAIHGENTREQVFHDILTGLRVEK